MHTVAKVTIDKTAIKRLEELQIKSAVEAVEELKDDLITSQTMPFDIGTMQNEETFVAVSTGSQARVSLITGSIQGRYLYYGISTKGNPLNYQTVNNPNAGSHWLQPYIDNGFLQKSYNRHFADNMKRGG